MTRQPQVRQVSAAAPAVGAVSAFGGLVAKGSTTHVAAFGDSLMWGQGLERSGRFAQQITNALPTIFGTKQAVISADASRSGAQIRARGDQRQTFPDTFPSLFQSASERAKFLKALDESPASRLYGEVPATFPTVRGQVAMVPDALGKTIDVALVNGGVNDISPQDIINPQVSTGQFVERWDGEIRSVFRDDVLELIGRVRHKCPNAIILYFGFFSPLSYRSSKSKIREAFKYELDDDVGWWINGLLGIKDVDAAVLEAVTRAVWMQGRFQYWARQAVVVANRTEALRGPGVLFVPSAFQPENSVFASAPYLWEAYRPPTKDPAQAERKKRCPRIDQIDKLQGLYDWITSTSGPQGRLMPPTSSDTNSVLGKIDGPLLLKESMKAYLADASSDNLATMTGYLRTEILRIRRAVIASMSHPNPAGAKSYAQVALGRLRSHADALKRIAVEQRPGSPAAGTGTGETLDTTLRRYGLRGTGPIQSAVGHQDVDSLAVQVTTGATSARDFFPDVWLEITVKGAKGISSRRQYKLNFEYTRKLFAYGPAIKNQRAWWVSKLYPQFEPGTTSRFTIDTMGRLRLDEVTKCVIRVGGDRLAGKQPLLGRSYGKFWRPAEVRLEVNGQEVASVGTSGSLGFDTTLDLGYPPPVGSPAVQLQLNASR